MPVESPLPYSVRMRCAPCDRTFNPQRTGARCPRCGDFAHVYSIDTREEDTVTASLAALLSLALIIAIAMAVWRFLP